MKTFILFILCFWLLPAWPALGQVDGRIDREPTERILKTFRQGVMDGIGSEYLIEDDERDERLEWEEQLDEWIAEVEADYPEFLQDQTDDEDGNTQ